MPWVLLGMAMRHGVSPRRLPVFAGMLACHGAAEPLRVLDRAVHGRALAEFELAEPPIVVLGHWRSGTSWLQELLAHDPRFTTTTLYNTLFADISDLTEPWLKPAMNRVASALHLPFSLQREDLDLDHCGEADVGLWAQGSPYAYTWGHIFPRRWDDWLERCVLDPSPDDAEAWLADLHRYLCKLSRASGGRRVVLKSPGDTGRVGLLAERWPEARFVFIHRDPVAVFHSNRYLWQVIRREYSVQTVSDAEVDELILSTYDRVMRRYLAERDAVPHLVEVAYEALRGDPVGELDRLYEGLQLGAVPAEVASFVAEHPPRPPRSWNTPPPLEARIRQRWGFAFDAWSRP